MQTVQLELNDDLYSNLSAMNVDIQTKVKDYLFNLVDDGYESISTEEVKERVSDAVNRYKNGTGIYTNDNEYLDHKSNMIDSIKSKYANN